MSTTEKLKSKTAAPDIEIARAFVAALTGSTHANIRLRFLDDDKSKARADRLPAQEREGTIDDLWPELLTLQGRGYGAFYFLSEMRSDIDGFATDADATGVRAYAADFDHGLPEEWEFHSQPSVLVKTSTVEGVRKGQAHGCSACRERCI